MSPLCVGYGFPDAANAEDHEKAKTVIFNATDQKRLILPQITCL
jgi:hypothetical protein